MQYESCISYRASCLSTPVVNPKGQIQRLMFQWIMIERIPNRLSRSKKVDTCKRATSLIWDYLTGELDPEMAISFEDHLSKCSDCMAFLNTYKKTIQITRSYLRKKS